MVARLYLASPFRLRLCSLSTFGAGAAWASSCRAISVAAAVTRAPCSDGTQRAPWSTKILYSSRVCHFDDPISQRCIRTAIQLLYRCAPINRSAHQPQTHRNTHATPTITSTRCPPPSPARSHACSRCRPPRPAYRPPHLSWKWRTWGWDPTPPLPARRSPSPPCRSAPWAAR